jgi:Zn-dependent oligopeptidase
VTHQLFGIEWKKLSGIPVYHPDVEVFEILDEKKSHLGLLYVDLFPRDEKRSGAWMTHFRDQGKFRGTIGRPHVSIVCSFTPASGDRPSLLTPNELNTLFHEAGHALHLLLSQTRHRSLAGTNVAWDFVELPSQLMENWASEPEAILTYARHYQTGEKPPESLLQKFKKSHQYEKGLFWIRQMQYAELDWGWHSENPDRFVSVEEMEKKVRPRVSVLPLVEGTLISPFFSHIFSGGYSAGYYSYAWADVLAADAFEAFEEEGLLNSETGRRLMREVLSKGGSEKPSKLYRNFRGHDPDPDSLFRRDGLI